MGGTLGCGGRAVRKDGYTYTIGPLEIAEKLAGASARACNGQPGVTETKEKYTFRPQDRNLTILIDLDDAPREKMPLNITGSWIAKDTHGYVDNNSTLGAPVVAKVNNVPETIRFNVNVDQNLPVGEYELVVDFNGSHEKKVPFTIAT